MLRKREHGGFVVLFVFLEEIAKYPCLLWTGFNDIYPGLPSPIFLINHYWVLKLKFSRKLIIIDIIIIMNILQG